MIVLSQTTDKIQVVLASAVAANQAQCVACWRDITATPSYTPGRSLANSNNMTDVDLVAPPGASTQRTVDYLSVFNADTSPITVIVKFDANGTDYVLWKGTINSGERIEYENAKGWTVATSTGQIKSIGADGTPGTDGADGALSITEVEVNFGSVPLWEKVFTITDAGVSGTSKIIATQSGKAAIGQDTDENEMDSLILSCSPGSGSFTLFARAVPGPVSGKFKINYQFS